MIGVLDANAVIGLAKGRCFEVLRNLFDLILIPPGVVEEVIKEGKGRPGSTELSGALGRWIEIRDPSASILARFARIADSTDRALVALACEVRADWLITDDESLRRMAEDEKVPILFVAEVLLTGKRAGYQRELRPILDSMRRRGYGIRETLYQEILRLAGESAP
jgi:predicted nucleic acid-binding protein